MHKHVAFVPIAYLIAIAQPALAADCSAIVNRLAKTGGASVALVTINNNSVASYYSANLSYFPSFHSANGAALPGRLAESSAVAGNVDSTGFNQPQLFSDRQTSNGQPFDVQQADKLTVAIVNSNPVSVTITLLSHGSAKITFNPTCEAGDFLRGTTPDVVYLFRLKKIN